MALVTRVVKALSPPSTLPENVCTPPTTEAARSAPGKALEPRPTDGIDGAEVDTGVPPPNEPVESGW